MDQVNVFAMPEEGAAKGMNDGVLKERVRDCLRVAGVALGGATWMVTGHRPPGLTGAVGRAAYDEGHPRTAWTRRALGVVVGFAADRGASRFLSGMALGVDTLWAEAVLEREAKLVAAVPFEGQASAWPKASQRRYLRILGGAAHVEQTSGPGYAPYKMDVRNSWMVDESDVVIAVWNGQQVGGTWNCMMQARRRGKPVIVLDPAAMTVKLFA